MKRFLLGCVNGWVGAILGALWGANVYLSAVIRNFYFPANRTAFSNLVARPDGALVVLVGALMGGVALHFSGLALRRKFNEQPKQAKPDAAPIAEP